MGLIICLLARHLRETAVVETAFPEKTQIEKEPAAISAPTKDENSFDSPALKRLQDRSAKERMEKVHEEWLKNRRAREAQGEGGGCRIAEVPVSTEPGEVQRDPPAGVFSPAKLKLVRYR